MASHEVKQGEHLSGIAAQYGFLDYHAIWDDPANADLKALRGDPHVLMPGDVVVIPDITPKTFKCATGSVHKFVVKRGRLRLRIALRDFDGEPVTSTSCTLTVGSVVHEVETDADGTLDVEVSEKDDQGKIEIPSLGLAIPIRIGSLDPVDQPTGQSARLANLGYLRGEPGGDDEKRLRYAIEEFQCDQDIQVTGECDDATGARLLKVHGC